MVGGQQRGVVRPGELEGRELRLGQPLEHPRPHRVGHLDVGGEELLGDGVGARAELVRLRDGDRREGQHGPPPQLRVALGAGTDHRVVEVGGGGRRVVGTEAGEAGVEVQGGERGRRSAGVGGGGEGCLEVTGGDPEGSGGHGQRAGRRADDDELGEAGAARAGRLEVVGDRHHPARPSVESVGHQVGGDAGVASPLLARSDAGEHGIGERRVLEQDAVVPIDEAATGERLLDGVLEGILGELQRDAHLVEGSALAHQRRCDQHLAADRAELGDQFGDPLEVLAIR